MRKSRTVHALLVQSSALAAVVLGVIAFGFTVHLRNLRRENHLVAKEIELRHAATATEHHLVTVAQSAVHDLASCPDVIEVARGEVEPDAPRAHLVLDTARKLIKAEIAYIMDATGTVVASTHYDGDSSSLTGKSYAFRPYFSRAIAGQNTTYAALGVTTLRRGLYFASPILAEDSLTPVGVVVAKMGLQGVDRILSQLEGPACLLSPDGIVFASTRKAWLFGAAHPLSAETREALRASRQFADAPLAPINVDLSQDRIELDGETFVRLTATCSLEGWKLVSCICPSSQFPLSSGQKAMVLFLFGSLLFLLLAGLLVAVSMFQRRQAQERYREVIENMNEAILVLQDRKMVFFNDRTLEMTGYTTDSIQAMDGLSLVHPLDRDRANRVYTALTDGDGQQSGSFEARIERADGATLWVLISAVRANWHGRPSVMAFVVDITERKRLQDRFADANRMESIGQLAGGVAHDFNNLLAAIIGYTELLRESLSEDEEERGFVEAIDSAAQRAAELTEQLLGFARGGQHRSEPVNMEGVIKETVEFLSRTLGRNIKIETRLGAARTTVIGDVAQLKQVLGNLAVNARDAMPEGGALTIETRNVRRSSSGGEYLPKDSDEGLEIRVIDTGFGIKEEDISRIFEPFFTSKRKGKGTGMGLAMVYGIIVNHGGTIDVASEEDKGSTFTVLLPCASTEVEPIVEHRSSEVANERFDGYRVMVVDDEAVVAALAESLLTRAGCLVDVFNTGADAVAHYREQAPRIHLVVLDMEMPGMDGGECFRELRKIDPNVKAILATGFGLNEKAQSLLDDGIQGFLKKPYAAAEMHRVVGDVLSSSACTP